MLNILILGANSYIGKHLKGYLEQYPADYRVTAISQRDDQWKELDFSVFDSVVDCVGIAHRKETKENAHEYYEINADLAFQTAKKAKASGVKQFIFLSSMSVYGMDEGMITKDTQPNPKTHYGKSKWQAEQQIAPLQDETFRVAIVRPPMVYGEGCKGNYQTLVKLAKILPVVPDYKNERSMISIENLNAYLKQLIDESSCGVFLPQDPVYHCTCDMIREIAKSNHRTPGQTALLNPFVHLFTRTTKGKKAFGNLIYK
jgi:UDP-glucose 4-epimerase